ncbi:hypothetical protein EHQ82_17020 [Leptospira selangorensis]|uniref:Uncharacterized protein n=1 Tax=Leptospira selangorensis TaxID=2484982 RepID=A0ABY2N3T6_9LEPT|nr:hypothetical protein [Leptospira selangorensis]TGM16528.1 hypothetical protein EHQ82_17020 [Leptospira selangorensis]
MDYKKLLKVKISELFPDLNNQKKVLIELEKCSLGNSKIEKERVFLSIVKSSNGNIDKIRDLVTVAKKDYRDVLAWAENPNKMSHEFTTNKKINSELEKKDKEQFKKWIKP